MTTHNNFLNKPKCVEPNSKLKKNNKFYPNNKLRVGSIYYGALGDNFRGGLLYIYRENYNLPP
jgi:hypothetical protein